MFVYERKLMKTIDYGARIFALDALKDVLHKKLTLTAALEGLQDKNRLDLKDLAFSMASRALTALDDHEISLAP